MVVSSLRFGCSVVYLLLNEGMVFLSPLFVDSRCNLLPLLRR